MLKYPKPQQNGNNKKPAFNIYWMYAIILLSLFALFYFQDASQTKEVDWTAFEKAALAGDLKKSDGLIRGWYCRRICHG